MAAGSRKSLNSREFLPMGRARQRLRQRCKPLLYVSWRSGLSMAKQDPNSSTSPSKPREQLAQYTGPAGSRSLAADRVGHQAAIRVPYHAGPPWVARPCLRLSRVRRGRTKDAGAGSEAHGPYARGPLGKTGLHNKALQLSKRGRGIRSSSAFVINVRFAAERQCWADSM
jgi:hypothetical protein